MTVTFRRSGTQALLDGRASSLLEFAESLGVKVESGCRAGSCGSCQVTLEAGEVQYDQLPISIRTRATACCVSPVRVPTWCCRPDRAASERWRNHFSGSRSCRSC